MKLNYYNESNKDKEQEKTEASHLPKTVSRLETNFGSGEMNGTINPKLAIQIAVANTVT